MVDIIYVIAAFGIAGGIFGFIYLKIYQKKSQSSKYEKTIKTGIKFSVFQFFCGCVLLLLKATGSV